MTQAGDLLRPGKCNRPWLAAFCEAVGLAEAFDKLDLWLWFPGERRLRGLIYVLEHLKECQPWTDLIFAGSAREAFTSMTTSAGQLHAALLENAPRKRELRHLWQTEGPLHGLLETAPPYACTHMTAACTRHEPINRLLQTMLLGAGYRVQDPETPVEERELYLDLCRAYRFATASFASHVWDTIDEPDDIDELQQSLEHITRLVAHDDQQADYACSLLRLYRFCQSPFPKKKRGTSGGGTGQPHPAVGRGAISDDGDWILFGAPASVTDARGTIQMDMGHDRGTETDPCEVSLGLAPGDVTEQPRQAAYRDNSHWTRAYSAAQYSQHQRHLEERIRLQTFETQLDHTRLTSGVTARLLSQALADLQQRHKTRAKSISLLLVLWLT